MTRLRLVAMLVALVATRVAAHEKGDRAMGVVEIVAPERIVVKTADGHQVSFTVTPETRFFRDGKPARSEDVQVGQRAVVHGKTTGNVLQAMQVKLGDAPKSQ